MASLFTWLDVSTQERRTMLHILERQGFLCSGANRRKVLAVDDRSDLLQNLRPPSGYELDHAIGTTFALNLSALLRIPLGFSEAYWADEERAAEDPLMLLDAVKTYASKISIFCQNGRISVPALNHSLLHYFEESIFQVKTHKRGYAFHPKIWILRFVSNSGPAIYRALFMTRNITLGARWDTVLALEGEVLEDTTGSSDNLPLQHFLFELPRLSLSSLPVALLRRINDFQKDLLRMRFEPPKGFRTVKFRFLGGREFSSWPFEQSSMRHDGMLIMSPFLSDECLVRLSGDNRRDVLISLYDSLARTKRSVRERFARVLFYNPAHLFKDSNEQAGGLHAKLCIAENGETARIWTGSANANNDAYGGNTEFLVELVGDRSTVGIDAFLGGSDGKNGFLSLLDDFQMDPQTAVRPEGSTSLLEAGRIALAEYCFVAHVDRDSSLTYKLTVKSDSRETSALPEGLVVRCKPITLSDSSYHLVTNFDSVIAEFGGLSLESITAFFAFELATGSERRETERLVIKANWG